MSAVNCWEYKKCGREVNGVNAHEMGVCPAATFDAADGFCGGKNGGRACAYITGTFCSGTVQGTHEEKSKHCEACDFYLHIRKEHIEEMSVFKFLQYVKQPKVKKPASQPTPVGPPRKTV